MPRPGALRRREDFEKTLRGGRRTSVSGISIVAAPRDDDGAPRVGLAVRASTAVRRNRIKRRIRAAVAEADVRGVDLVVRAEESAAGRDYQEMVEAIRRAAGRVRA